MPTAAWNVDWRVRLLNEMTDTEIEEMIGAEIPPSLSL
jgi:hypothetical protein